MNLKRTQLHILHKKTDLSRKAKAGVSLHCHTEHSKEMMDFVPNYADRIPIISTLWQREKAKYTEREGREPIFQPLTGRRRCRQQKFTQSRKNRSTMPVSMRLSH